MPCAALVGQGVALRAGWPEHRRIDDAGRHNVDPSRRDLLRNRVPTVPCGGTVDYVNPTDHRYISDPAHREEGGTPGIIESIPQRE